VKRIISSEELHAFLIGLFEVLCPWKPRYPMTDQAEFKPDREYHYYLAGRAAGFFGLLLFIKHVIFKGRRNAI